MLCGTIFIYCADAENSTSLYKTCHIHSHKLRPVWDNVYELRRCWEFHKSLQDLPPFLNPGTTASKIRDKTQVKQKTHLA